jgi:hypothetical protein
MPKEFLKCEKCNPKIMDRVGCCTTDVGRGMKEIVNRTTGDRLLVCALLTLFEDRTWGCGKWETRPPMCQGFFCHLLVNKK